DKIREEREQGRTFIFTSHVMSELEELVDDIVLLIDGSVRFAGSLRDLTTRTKQINLERAVAQLMRESIGAGSEAA
ncbi:MAG TPA: ABC transporter ATP-binding protein, partial [Casimicrobiaceae bacterium]|nr:ABC transporter ATP-binding protein [Casimicrobiaceae bacterium]